VIDTTNIYFLIGTQISKPLPWFNKQPYWLTRPSQIWPPAHSPIWKHLLNILHSDPNTKYKVMTTTNNTTHISLPPFVNTDAACSCGHCWQQEPWGLPGAATGTFGARDVYEAAQYICRPTKLNTLPRITKSNYIPLSPFRSNQETQTYETFVWRHNLELCT
jgi:hypothetical protein